MRKTTLFVLMALALSPAFSQQQNQVSKRIQKAFAPGFAFGFYQHLVNSNMYVGGSFHYDLAQTVTPSQSDTGFGGYTEIFAEVGFFKEINSAFNDDIFFTYLFGFNLSFEKFLNGIRRFLIPYFGMKVGGIFISQFGSGFALIPTIGINLFSTRSLNVSIDSQFLLNSAALSQYISLGATLNLNLNL
jgi:hypothetical protein